MSDSIKLTLGRPRTRVKNREVVELKVGSKVMAIRKVRVRGAFSDVLVQQGTIGTVLKIRGGKEAVVAFAGTPGTHIIGFRRGNWTLVRES